jgi:hypothetical protein
LQPLIQSSPLLNHLLNVATGVVAWELTSTLGEG